MKEIKLTLSEQDACAVLTAVTALLSDENAPVSACARVSKVAIDIIQDLLESENPLVMIGISVQENITEYVKAHKEIKEKGGNPIGKG